MPALPTLVLTLLVSILAQDERANLPARAPWPGRHGGKRRHPTRRLRALSARALQQLTEMEQHDDLSAVTTTTTTTTTTTGANMSCSAMQHILQHEGIRTAPIVRRTKLDLRRRLDGAIESALNQRSGLARPAGFGQMQLSFGVCGGLINQRLALLTAMLLAHLFNMTLRLPRINLNGLQIYAAGERTEPFSETAPFGTLFDVDATTAALAQAGVQVTSGEAYADAEKIEFTLPALAPGVHLNATSLVQRAEELLRPQAGRRAVVQLRECAFGPLSRLTRHHPHLQRAFWRLDAALVPAAGVAAAAAAIVSRLQALSRAWGGAGSFTALHMRSEADWIAHCARWDSMPASPGNCLTNIDAIGNVFIIEGADKKQPIYVATSLEEAAGASEGRLRKVRGLSTLTAYRLVSKETIAADVIAPFAGKRELLAYIDLLVCDRASRFAGNSVSTFSAYLLMRRRHIGLQRDDFWYNGGPIPLQSMMTGLLDPLSTSTERPLKWVFTINANPTEAFERACKLAVTSALAVTTLVPVCIFKGEQNYLSDWLAQRGVRIIFYSSEPSWSPSIHRAFLTGVGADDAAAGNASAGRHTSTNFRSAETMATTFLRIDIPALGFVDEYVLYADVDVLFTNDVSLAHFWPPPAMLAVGTEAADRPTRRTSRGPIFYSNAGVMLLNVEALRKTYSCFVRETFSVENVQRGLDFGSYGPLDQGAYNRFYQQMLDVHESPRFNWKPYWGAAPPDTSILHFHGPKPEHYLEQAVATGQLAGLMERCGAGSGHRPACRAHLNLYKAAVRAIEVDSTRTGGGLPASYNESLRTLSEQVERWRSQQKGHANSRGMDNKVALQQQATANARRLLASSTAPTHNRGEFAGASLSSFIAAASLALGIAGYIPESPLRGGERRYVAIDACGGFTHQRMSLVQGVLIARLMGRTVVFPHKLSANARLRIHNRSRPVRKQSPAQGAGWSQGPAVRVPFEAFYNYNQTAAALRKHGIRVASDEERQLVHNNASSPAVNVRGQAHPASFFRELMPREQIVRVGCTFGGLGALEGYTEREFWAIDRALIIADAIMERAQKVVKRLGSQSKAAGGLGRYNALHARVDDEWAVYCRQWESAGYGDNCLTNTDSLHNTLIIEGFSRSLPIYLAGELRPSADTVGTLASLRTQYGIYTKEKLSSVLSPRHRGLMTPRSLFAVGHPAPARHKPRRRAGARRSRRLPGVQHVAQLLWQLDILLLRIHAA